MERRKDGTFTSLGLKGNQYAKGNSPNRTSFKKGQHGMEKHPCWKGGIQKHKDSYYVALGDNKRIRRGRWVWERFNGPVPEGCVVYHIDGDKHNDDINNLEVITRKELMKRNDNKRKYGTR